MRSLFFQRSICLSTGPFRYCYRRLMYTVNPVCICWFLPFHLRISSSSRCFLRCVAVLKLLCARVRACMRGCMRGCVRACMRVRLRACVWAGVRAGVCVPGCVWACAGMQYMYARVHLAFPGNKIRRHKSCASAF